MYNLAKFLKNINSRSVSFQGSCRFNEPMADHTSFRTGGPAGLWIRPEGGCFPEYAALLLESAQNEGIPLFIMGGGANIVVSDSGIDGIILDTTGYSDNSEEAGGGPTLTTLPPTPSSPGLCFKAGTSVDYAADYAAAHGLSGMEFLAGMPGSIGGALWMNARCYEREMADIAGEVQLLEGGEVISVAPKKEEFGYKKSPFQKRACLILNASFALQEKDPVIIKAEMEGHKADREAKGHYRFPSAGSVFKNNRAFGKPTGKIIDELGLKGLSVGDAQIAPWHGNMIINKGKALSSDIETLVKLIERRVKEQLGFGLEREIIFIGNL